MPSPAPAVLHVGEWDGSSFRPACEVLQAFVPPRLRSRRQRPTTNAGRCLACSYALRQAA